jgi:hypothetical protein
MYSLATALPAERDVLLDIADFVVVASIADAKSVAAFAYSLTRSWFIWRMFVLTTSGFTSALGTIGGFGSGFQPAGLPGSLYSGVGGLTVGGLSEGGIYTRCADASAKQRLKARRNRIIDILGQRRLMFPKRYATAI